MCGRPRDSLAGDWTTAGKTLYRAERCHRPAMPVLKKASETRGMVGTHVGGAVAAPWSFQISFRSVRSRFLFTLRYRSDVLFSNSTRSVLAVRFQLGAVFFSYV